LHKNKIEFFFKKKKLKNIIFGIKREARDGIENIYNELLEQISRFKSEIEEKNTNIKILKF